MPATQRSLWGTGVWRQGRRGGRSQRPGGQGPRAPDELRALPRGAPRSPPSRSGSPPVHGRHPRAVTIRLPASQHASCYLRSDLSAVPGPRPLPRLALSPDRSELLPGTRRALDCDEFTRGCGDLGTATRHSERPLTWNPSSPAPPPWFPLPSPAMLLFLMFLLSPPASRHLTMLLRSNPLGIKLPGSCIL